MNDCIFQCRTWGSSDLNLAYSTKSNIEWKAQKVKLIKSKGRVSLLTFQIRKCNHSTNFLSIKMSVPLLLPWNHAKVYAQCPHFLYLYVPLSVTAIWREILTKVEPILKGLSLKFLMYNSKRRHAFVNFQFLRKHYSLYICFSNYFLLYYYVQNHKK